MTTTRLRRLGHAGIALFLLIAIIVELTPFYTALTTAFKAKTDLSPQWLLPSPARVYLHNFTSAVQDAGILHAMMNSAIVTVCCTVLLCLLGAMAAYPLARRASRLNKAILGVVMAIMMIPPLSTLVPLYTLVVHLGGINTYWGPVLVLTAGALPMSIFFYTSFMRSLPVSIEEAGMVDGANTFQVLLHVVIPMLRPVTATVAIVNGLGIWNEYALSQYLMNDPSVRTVAPSIATFFSSSTGNLPAAAAASLISVVPVLVAYIFLQRYFVQGTVGFGK